MKKFFIILFFVPFSLFSQNCDTINNISNADSIVYCVSDASCHTFNDGKIEITVYPLSQAYYFSWNGGTPLLGVNVYDSLIAGSYQVIITDFNGAFIDFQDFDIDEPAVIGNYDSISNPSCYGYLDGNIAIFTYGDAPFSWSWNDGISSESRDSLSSGEYILTTTDSNGCIKIDTFNLIDPPKVSSIILFDSLSCIDSCDGYAIAVPNSGFSPYTFQWDDPLLQTNDTISNLCYGDYRVIITDANGCLDTNNIFINNPDTLQLSSVILNDPCFQICDGEILINIEGGSSPYNVIWSQDTLVVDSSSSIIDSTFLNNLCPDTYSVLYTDGNGCSGFTSFFLAERDSFTVLPSITPIDCYNNCTGEISVQIINPNLHNPPFTFQWSNGDTTSVASDLCSGDSIRLHLIDNRGCMDTFYYSLYNPMRLSFNLDSIINNKCFGDSAGAIFIDIGGGTPPISRLWSNGEITEDITDLSAGYYTLSIQDQNLCQADTSILVAEPLAIDIIPSIEDPSCNGYNDGLITLFINGGTYPYNFIWNIGGLLDTNIIDSLGAGIYYYTVIDSNNCQASDSISLTEPDIINVEDTVIDVLCSGYHTGQINLTITGGTLPYQYNWSNGDTGPNLINVSAGNYSLVMTDNNGCLYSSSFFISEPLPFSILLENTPILCNGYSTGNVGLIVNNSTPPYNYIWNTGSTADTISGLSAGIYTVTIIDNNGCDTSASILLDEPDLIVIDTTIHDVLCYSDSSGAIEITVSGGFWPYNFNWSNGDTVEDISNLVAGNYNIIVTDTNGCNSSISLTVEEPDLLSGDLFPVNISCYGQGDGSIDLSVSGGTENYTYNWSGPNSFFSTNEDVSPLLAGMYVVIITDANECVFEDSISIIEPAALNIPHVDIDDITCNGENSGAINLTINGGIPPYTFNWSNGDVIEDITNLSAGNYMIEITDQNNCNLSGAYFVNQPDPFFESEVNIVNVECHGELTGSISVIISGSTPPYTYNWSPVSSSVSSIYNLSYGDYDLTVSDINNCITTFSYYISEPEEIIIDYTVFPSSCEENNDGRIQTSISGGVPPYEYIWDNGGNTPVLSDLAKGTYTLQIKDANSCLSIQESIEVSFDGFEGCIEIPTGFTPNNDGIHDEWNIYGLYNFSDIIIRVFNRWGQEIFFSEGYGAPWDGKYNGEDLPIATYYYIIEIPSAEKMFNGTVTIKR